VDAARSAEPSDLPVIVDLARQAIEELSQLRGGQVWRQREARREPVEADLAQAVAESDGPGGAAVVGTIYAAVVGYGISRTEHLADGSLLSVVTDLYVHPDARGVGVGEVMMDRLAEHATAHGAVGIDSLALPGDRATKNFFETFGLKARAIVVHRPLGEPS